MKALDEHMKELRFRSHAVSLNQSAFLALAKGDKRLWRGWSGDGDGGRGGSGGQRKRLSTPHKGRWQLRCEAQSGDAVGSQLMDLWALKWKKLSHSVASI